MTKEDIRQNAIAYVTENKNMCTQTECKNCSKKEDCSEIFMSMYKPNADAVFAYEQGFADGIADEAKNKADERQKFAESIRADERRKIAAKIEGHLAVKYGDGNLTQQFTSMEIIDYVKTLLKVGEKK